MPSIRIIYDVEGWAFHHRALALQKYAPAGFDVSIAPLGRPPDAPNALGDTPVDLVFSLPDSQMAVVRQALRRRGWRSKLIGAWNAGWPRRLPHFYATYRTVDAVIINNQTGWERTGKLPRTHLLPNGVDLDVFRITVPLEQRRAKVLWVGSEVGRHRKGYDRFVLPLQEKLQALGIACELLLVDSHASGKRSPCEMADWYNAGTVLVCASEAEGTPNVALEAAACGCTVVSTAVGNMPELIRDGVNGYLVERDAGALFDGVKAACTDYLRLATQMQDDIQAWHWKHRGAQFFDVFRQVLAGQNESPPPRIDLSHAVTVFVTTVGAPTFDLCLDLLRQQDCTFKLQIIDHVAPMSAAFQRMLDDCTTPYYVQVDEDMLLYPHAVRTLYEEMCAACGDVAFVIFSLHDAHLDQPIQGVKIFRHATVVQYPFENVQSFEKVQRQLLRADGYVVPYIERTLGLHGTHWTPRSIYERYATLERRRYGHPRDLHWFEAYPGVFLHRFLEDPSDLNFFALMGAVSGALIARRGARSDKDYRTFASLPGFEALCRFLDECRCTASPQGGRDRQHEGDV